MKILKVVVQTNSGKVKALALPEIIAVLSQYVESDTPVKSTPKPKPTPKIATYKELL